MRILFWAGKFWPQIGGTATFAARLLPALKQRGYEILVVAPQSDHNQPSQDNFKGIPVRRFPFWDQNTYRMIDRLWCTKTNVAILKREFSPDLIHLSALDIGHFFHLETKKAHLSPILVTLHGIRDSINPPIQKHSTLEDRVLESASWVTCVSNALLEQKNQMTPGIILRSTVIHNGLDVPPVLPTPLPFSPPILLYLGRLSKEKGADRALTILPSLVRRCPSIRLLVAGDGPERLNLERQASELGIRKHVHFLGMIAVEEVAPLINNATLVVMPSRMESFGFVAVEAALMGRPVVATRVGGLSEIVAHSKTGLLVNNEDCQELCEAISYLLENPQMAEQMGQAARCRAMEKFSLRKCVDAYDSLYQKLGNVPVVPKAKNVIRVHTHF